MANFHDTVMGSRFFNHQLPQVISMGTTLSDRICDLTKAIQVSNELRMAADKKYMLISVCDREILTETFPNIEAAQAVMHEELATQGRVPAEEIVGVEADCGDWGFGPYCAYANDGCNHADFDWLIVVL